MWLPCHSDSRKAHVPARVTDIRGYASVSEAKGSRQVECFPDNRSHTSFVLVYMAYSRKCDIEENAVDPVIEIVPFQQVFNLSRTAADLPPFEVLRALLGCERADMCRRICLNPASSSQNPAKSTLSS